MFYCYTTWHVSGFITRTVTAIRPYQTVVIKMNNYTNYAFQEQSGDSNQAVWRQCWQHYTRINSNLIRPLPPDAPQFYKWIYKDFPPPGIKYISTPVKFTALLASPLAHQEKCFPEIRRVKNSTSYLRRTLIFGSEKREKCLENIRYVCARQRRAESTLAVYWRV